MIGRRRELGLLLQEMDVLGPAGRAVLVLGQAGIGKTTLLDSFEEAAVSLGAEVLRCGGVDRSGQPGFSALHQLLHPLRDAFATLPVRQREALEAALGMGSDLAPDPLLINLAALGVLEEASASRLVVVLIEDLHWVDPSSAAAIAFIVRRLTNAPILVVASMRSEVASVLQTFADDATLLELGPMPSDEAIELIRSVAPTIDERARQRVVKESAGNPLAITEFAAIMTESSDFADDAATPRLPTSGRLSEAFLGDFASLPQGSQELLLLAAAADDRTTVAELLGAAAAAGIGDQDLFNLEESRLVILKQERLVFRHPLVRSAVYGAASIADRANAHRRLADVSADPVTRAWHLAAGCLERDESVAVCLLEAARVAQMRGALPEAVSAWRRAAELSPEPADRVHRLTYAAELARGAGLGNQARAVLDEVVPIAQAPADVVLLVITEGMFSMTLGGPARSIDDILALARRIQGDSPEHTLELRTRLLASAAGRAQAVGVDHGLATRLKRTAIELLGSEDGWAQQAVLAFADPVAMAPTMRPLLPDAIDQVRHVAFVDGREREPGTSLWMHVFGRVAETLHDMDTALRAHDEYWRYTHTIGTVSDESNALHARAIARLMMGDLSGASTDTIQSYQLGLNSGSPRSAAAAIAISAVVHALRGNREQALSEARRSDELSDFQAHAIINARARWAAGLVALADGRYNDAWLELGEVAIHSATAVWAVADVVEAGVRSGHADSARAIVDEAERHAHAYDSPLVWAIVHRARATLDDDDSAEEHYARSIEAAIAAPATFETARSQLAYGEWLRRRRRIIDARAHLERAKRAFERAGAYGPASRAAAELRAAGVTTDGRALNIDGPNVFSVLTPQELQVVQLAAAGLSNKEIADQVYLSHRTVAAHLYKAFPKLGVTNRAQLVDLLRRSEDRRDEVG